MAGMELYDRASTGAALRARTLPRGGRWVGSLAETDSSCTSSLVLFVVVVGFGGPETTELRLAESCKRAVLFKRRLPLTLENRSIGNRVDSKRHARSTGEKPKVQRGR